MGEMIPENLAGAKPVQVDAAERAAAFLERIATGSGRVAIAAIPPDEKPQGATLALPTDRHRLVTALRKGAERGVNLYFTLNEPKPREEQDGKAGKLCEADVAAIRGVAVDIDPDPQSEAAPGGFERERQRLSFLALEALADAHCPATAAIDSGNGVQLLWLFPEPLPATEENREAVKRQAAGLALHFGGDAVQSLDHLFRIPFTKNIPNAKKRAKGRQERPTALLAWNDANRHPLEALAAIAPPADTASKAGPAVALVDLDFGAVLDAAQGGPDALPDHLKGWAAKLQERRGFSSAMEKADRSARDFELAANCVSMGMTDPGAIAQLVFAFSPEKLLEEEETRGAGERHAQRTISKALASAERDPLPQDYFQPVEAAQGATEASQGTKRRAFALLDADELESRPPEWLVRGVLETDSLALLFGASGCGKSFVAVDLALSVATGTPFHGRPVRQGPVVYIAGEGRNGLGRRFDAWCAHHQTSRKGAPIAVSRSSAKFLTAENLKDVAEALDEFAQSKGVPALILVDTLARNFGPGDENSTQDMSRFIDAVDAMRLRYPGCTVLIVHHVGLTDKHRPRGNGALTGGVDIEYRLERSDSTLTMSNLKMKDGPEPAPIAFETVAIDLGAEPDGQPFGSLALKEVAPRPKVEGKRLTANAETGLKAFRAARDKLSKEDERARVHVDDWRTEFHRICTADGSEAKRKAFQRARNELTRGGYLEVADDFYMEAWPTE